MKINIGTLYMIFQLRKDTATDFKKRWWRLFIMKAESIALESSAWERSFTHRQEQKNHKRLEVTSSVTRFHWGYRVESELTRGKLAWKSINYIEEIFVSNWNGAWEMTVVHQTVSRPILLTSSMLLQNWNWSLQRMLHLLHIGTMAISSASDSSTCLLKTTPHELWPWLLGVTEVGSETGGSWF